MDIGYVLSKLDWINYRCCIVDVSHV